MKHHISRGRAVALGAGAAGLAAVAVLGGGIASAAGGNPPPPPGGSGTGSGPASATSSGQAPAAAPSGAPSTRPSGAPPAGQSPAVQGGAPAAGPGAGPGGPGAGGPGVVHGRFVRQSGTSSSPTYVTEDVQQGTVTDISATSLTVTSTDGYSETYVLTGSTRYGRDGTASDIAVDDKVSVRATVADGTATATSVEERTAPAPRPVSSGPTS